MLASYSSPLNLGHKGLEDFWSGLVFISEKIDGSQFSFGVRGGVLLCRSRNAQIDLSAPGMFTHGVQTAQALFEAGQLNEGWTYRAEYLSKPKHNTLVYDRVPQGNIVIFDIDRGDQDYLNPEGMVYCAEDLGLECVPTLRVWTPDEPRLTPDEVQELLKQDSMLGNVKIEGVVLKQYGLYGVDHKVVMAKMVSKDFREAHADDWKVRNPGRKDVIEGIVEQLRTEQRWQKAVQHLQEAGIDISGPQCIGALIREVQGDVLKEREEEIKEILFKHFWRDIGSGITRGLPGWFKQRLAKEIFNE